MPILKITTASYRYKNSEESLFREKESIRSQLEMLQEEKAKLSKVITVSPIQWNPSIPLNEDTPIQ